MIFLNPLLSVYTLSDETRHLAWLLVMIHAGSAIFLWPAGFVLPNALRAANDVRFTMLTSILSMGIWRLAFSYILCVQMGMGRCRNGDHFPVQRCHQRTEFRLRI